MDAIVYRCGCGTLSSSEGLSDSNPLSKMLHKPSLKPGSRRPSATNTFTSSNACNSDVQELQNLCMALPEDLPASTRGHFLAFLARRLGWRSKFSCEAFCTNRLDMLPANWVYDVIVLSPPGNPILVVDFDFRAKFVLQVAAAWEDTEQLHQILEQAPVMFIGTYSELRSEVERLALVVQRLYGTTGAALPPWRSHPVLRRFYKHCVEQDATECNQCLKEIKRALESTEAAATDCLFLNPSNREKYLEYLQHVLRQFSISELQNFSFGSASVELKEGKKAPEQSDVMPFDDNDDDDDALGYTFEKEIPSESQLPSCVRGGLSLLFRGM